MSNKILSQAEIDALLPAPSSGGMPGGSGGVVPYDFCRPDRVHKDELRALHFLHDRFAVNVSTSLSAYLRAVTEVSIVSAEQFMYSEFLMSLPDSTAFYSLDLEPHGMSGALEISPVVAFTILDRMLGGSGTGSNANPNRPLTEIELNVVDTVVKVLLENLADTWKSVTNIQFRVRARETRPQMLQVVDSNEIMVLFVFDVRLAENRGALHLCFPASLVEGIADTLAPGGQHSERGASAAEETWLHANLGRVPVNVSAQLEMTLPARELVRLRPGNVLALPQSSGAPVDVFVGQLPRFTGHLTLQSNDLIGVVVERCLATDDPQEQAA